MRRLWVGAAVVATMVLAGCANPAELVAERVIEQQAGDGVDIDLDSDGNGGMSVESEEGTYKVGSHAEVPASFPSDLPLPDATVSLALEEADSQSLMFEEVGADEAARIFAHFDDGEFERAYTAESDGTRHTMYQDAERSITVVHVADEGTLMMIVGPRTD